MFGDDKWFLSDFVLSATDSFLLFFFFFFFLMHLKNSNSFEKINFFDFLIYHFFFFFGGGGAAFSRLKSFNIGERSFLVEYFCLNIFRQITKLNRGLLIFLYSAAFISHFICYSKYKKALSFYFFFYLFASLLFETVKIYCKCFVRRLVRKVKGREKTILIAFFLIITQKFCFLFEIIMEIEEKKFFEFLVMIK